MINILLNVHVIIIYIYAKFYVWVLKIYELYYMSRVFNEFQICDKYFKKNIKFKIC